MYTLGIPKRQFRRATSVLGPESAEPIEYDSYKQDDGFWQFSFPEVDEYGFRDIVNLLKANGVTTIGADDQLTEKKIMKLSKLIKEQGSPDENEMIDILKRTLASWEQKSYRGGVEDCEKSDHYFEDIKDIIEDYEEEATMDRPSDLPAFGGLNEIYNSLTEQENKGLNRMDRDMTPEEEYLMNNPSPGTSSPMNTQSGEFKVNIPVQNETEEVTIKYGHATGPVDDVTISWGNESHNVDFEEEDIIDDHGNEGKDMTFVAYSQDDKWRFIVDVSVEANYDMSGNIQDVMWDSLEIDVDDNLRLEPEDMDNPDEDLVIIGSGALDIENNFGERPSMTNGEYAAKGQEFVNDRFGGDKEAALDYIYNQINETKGTLKEVFQRRAGIIKNR